MESANIRLSSTPLIGNALFGIGIVLTGLAAVAGLAGDASTASLAIHGLHAGVLIALSFSVGAIGFILANNVANAGWWSLLRKPFEHLAALAWLGGLMFLGVFILQAVYVNMFPATDKVAGEYAPYLWNWMDTNYRAGDVIYEHKSIYLNTPFFIVRCLLYFAIFIGVGVFLKNMTKSQDVDGDRWRTMHAGRASAIALPFYGFAIAFASFDWIMSLDYHWFSTMYGVYYFAGSFLGAITLCTLTFIVLSSVGKLRGAFTVEHQHDLAKWAFGITCFWGYITFSQYLLIWYAAIPEETEWFVTRKVEWNWLSYALPIGHFIVPFLVLLPRPNRRSPLVCAAMCVWILAFHVLDLYWNVRPEAKVPTGEAGVVLLDIASVGGPIAIFIGMYIRKLASGPLVPLNEPRTSEALEHKNYV